MNTVRPKPWTSTDHALFAALTLLGTALILLGWYGASGEVMLQDDRTWLNLAIVGVLVATVGNARWFLVGRRAVQRLRRELSLDTIAPSVSRDVFPDEAMAVDDFVAVAGLRRYHRPDCHLAAGKDVDSMSRAEHEAAERLPCGVCRP